MKICMLVTNPFTHDARVYKEARSLQVAGYQVTVLASHISGLRYKEMIDDIKVIRVRRRLPASFFSRLGFGFRLISKAKKEKADVYHAHDLSTLFESYIAAKFNQAKLVYDSHEVAIAPSSNDSLIFKTKLFFWSLLESILIHKADKVITVNEFIAQYLKKKYRINESPAVIMNCPKFIKVSEKNILRKKLGISKKNKIIIYYGVIQPGRNLEELIKSAIYLPVDYKIVILGECPSSNMEKYLRIIDENCLKNRIFFVEKMPFKVLLEYVSDADLIAIPFEKINLNFYYASPNKLFEAIMVKKPVIATDLPFFRKIILEEGIGYTFKSVEAKSIAKSISDCLNINNLRKIKINLEKAKSKYNWEIEEKKLIKLYDSLAP